MHIIFFHIYYGSDMVPVMVVMMALQIMVTVKWWYIFYKILFHFHYDNIMVPTMVLQLMVTVKW